MIVCNSWIGLRSYLFSLVAVEAVAVVNCCFPQDRDGGELLPCATVEVTARDPLTSGATDFMQSFCSVSSIKSSEVSVTFSAVFVFESTAVIFV